MNIDHAAMSRRHAAIVKLIPLLAQADALAADFLSTDARIAAWVDLRKKLHAVLEEEANEASDMLEAVIEGMGRPRPANQ